MNARLLLLAAAAAGLPCLSTMAAAQSGRSAREDSTQSSLPGGIPSLSMFAFGRGGAAGAATTWQCVGVCASSRALSVLGAPENGGVMTFRRGRGDDVAMAGGRGVAARGNRAAERRAAERAEDRASNRAMNRARTDGDGEFEGEYNAVESNGASGTASEYEAGASASLSEGAGYYAPAALAAGAAVGAGAVWAANQGGHDTPVPVTSTGVRKPPTLPMANPPAMGETANPSANQTATVPEPGSLALVVTGLAALGFRRRRER